jgi:PKD repeat protein
VQLSVAGPQGRTSSTAKTVTVGSGTAPTSTFTFSPTSPLPGQAVFFNGAASTAAPGRQIVRYDWDFGSGRTGEGVSTSKTYDVAGAFTVTLKVTDDANQVGTSTQTVTIGGGSATLPTASFTFSPTNPRPGDQIFFNASASTAGAGRQIVSYRWDFGSGRTGTGVTIQKGYETGGSYVVTLTVTDDQGQVGTVSQTVLVTTTPPTAKFVFSPTEPTPGQTVFFNAGESSAGSGRHIVSYEWTFGDSPTPATGAAVQHTYATAATYVVILKVTDDAGVSSTTSQPVTVKP